jgi:hypothetical protein
MFGGDMRILKLGMLADTSKFTKGLNQASKDTNTFVGKTRQAAAKIGKAFGLAGIAIAGMAAKLAIDGVKAAMADEKAQVKLATTLKNTTKATSGQIKSVEKYIDKLQRASGVADDKLRPSLQLLVTATGKITKAEKLQALAMDISAGTGKDLETVSLALAKAHNGNLGSLTRLGVKIDATTLKNKDFNAAAKELNKTFEGQSKAAAETMTGKFARFKIAIDEAKESIGNALMPQVEKLVDYLNSPKGQKVVTDFAEAFADAVKMMAKYLPGVVEHISKLVSKVSKQGLMAGLLDDPKLAVAAAAYGAGFIVGGPAGGAVAAMAAYAAGSAIQSGSHSTTTTTKDVLPAFQKMRETTFASGVKNTPNIGGGFLNTANPTNFTGTSVGVKNRNNVVINVTVNGAADARESARAIQKTLNKINLNGGSKAGILGFN